MTPADRALMIVARVGSAYGFTTDQLLGYHRGTALARCRARAYRAIRRELGWSLARIGRMFSQRTRQSVDKLMKEHPERSSLDIEDELEDARRRIQRLSGEHIAYKVAEKLQTPMWIAMFFSILIERSPKWIDHETLCECYDLAQESMRVGNTEQASYEMVRQFSTRIRKHFADLGLPNPIITQKPFGYRLSNEVLPWVAYNLQRPELAVGIAA